jgi:Alpha amylase, catalytic domain
MEYSPWMGNLMVQNTLGNYGTVKLLLDEDEPSSLPRLLPVRVEVARQGLSASNLEVEVFTNLDRRNFAKIYEPLGDAGTATSYWVTHSMQHVGQAYDNLIYEAHLPVTTCGAYRLTTRYRRVGATTWWWHNDFAPFAGAARQRDCAVVVSPAKTARVRLYEANALTVEAVQGGAYENRSTLDDFLPTHDFDGFNPFQLDYIIDTLGFNALWLMPVCPNTRWRWDRQRWNWAPNDNPGSPYAVRDYWSINPWLADNGNKERAMELFQQLVEAAHTLGLDVFLDFAFNHAGRDVVYGDGAVALGLCAAPEQDAWIREVRPSWCTRGTEFRDGRAIPYYRDPAHTGFECAVIAPADRLHEHVWDDANVDWFFGDYSALGPKAAGVQATDYWGNPVSHHDDRGSAEDERDLFYTDLGAATATAQLWSYVAHILPYWITKTGGKLAGVRADFAQGLPNQLWEFIVNKTRQARWDFVFLAEVLDPDPIQYRLNKVFDLLTTKDHSLYRKSDVRMRELFDSLETEARLFGGDALVMHNGTSHDEQGNPDKWVMVARYAVAAAVPGAPMVFMGQPLGLADKLPFRESWASLYEEWTRPDPERDGVAEMYRRINAARDTTPALTGPSRYFLNLASSGFHDQIFSVARWVDDGGVAAVVLVFVNLSPVSTPAAVFAMPRSIRLVGDYQAYNMVAQNPSAPLWPAHRSAEDLYASGVYVSFSYPNEVQYLRLTPG